MDIPEAEAVAGRLRSFKTLVWRFVAKKELEGVEGWRGAGNREEVCGQVDNYKKIFKSSLHFSKQSQIWSEVSVSCPIYSSHTHWYTHCYTHAQAHTFSLSLSLSS